MKTCSQQNCEAPAVWRYTWPGKDEGYACAVHGPQLEGLATTMGFHLQLLPLEIEPPHFTPLESSSGLDLNPGGIPWMDPLPSIELPAPEPPTPEFGGGGGFDGAGSGGTF